MSSILVARNSTVLFTAQAVARVAGLAIFMVLARFLTVGEIGLLGYAMSLVTFLTLAVDFGFDLVVTREAARGDGGGGAGLALRLKTIMFAVCYPVLLFSAFLLTGAGPVLAVVTLLGAAVWHESGNRTIGAYFLARGRAEYSLVSESVTSLFRLGLVVAAVGAGARLVGVGVAYVVASGVTTALLALWAWRHGFHPRFSGGAGDAQRVFREAAAFAVYSLLFQIYFRIDIVMLTALRPADEAGQYVAAFRVIEAMLAVPAALTGALYPVLSRLDADGDRARFDRGCREATRWLAVIGFGMSVVVGVASPLVLRIVAGPRYDIAAVYLRLLLPTFILICLSGVGLLALNAVGRQRWNARIMLVAAVTKVVWDLVLIPRYGVAAACWGSTFTSLVVVGCAVVAVRSWYSERAWAVASGGAALAGLAAAGLAWLVHGWPLGYQLGVSLVVFLVVALASGAIAGRDAATVRTLLSSRSSGVAEALRS
jgi:O-antigen/teichoic acid export membrane protein